MIKTFNKYIETLNDVKKYKRITLKLMDEYVNKYLTHINGYKFGVDFYFTRDNQLIISYLTKSGDSNTITFDINSEIYNDLIKFIDNPEIYRNMTKYNL